MDWPAHEFVQFYLSASILSKVIFYRIFNTRPCPRERSSEKNSPKTGVAGKKTWKENIALSFLQPLSVNMSGSAVFSLIDMGI